jgi:hypothetical protein
MRAYEGLEKLIVLGRGKKKRFEPLSFAKKTAENFVETIQLSVFSINS